MAEILPIRRRPQSNQSIIKQLNEGVKSQVAYIGHTFCHAAFMYMFVYMVDPV